jgi:hypothetical protein
MIDQLRVSRRVRGGVALALLALAAGCDDGILGSGRGQSLPRDTFMETMVELRLSAYRENNDGVLPPGAHEEILSRNGVSVEEMVGFIEVHGRDIPFMDSLWTEIDGHVRAGLEARTVESAPTTP